MIFSWDEKKNQHNRKKHGVWFEEAKTVFIDDYARVFYDEQHSKKENRFIIIGKTNFNRILIVIHCYRKNDEIIRLISARKAIPKERRFYEERIQF